MSTKVRNTVGVVKVQRYVKGKRPQYAGASEHESSEESDANEEQQYDACGESSDNQNDINTERETRLRRLSSFTTAHRRSTHVPEILEGNVENDIEQMEISNTISLNLDSNSDEELSDAELYKRRMKLKQQWLHRENKQPSEPSGISESESSSEYEEESESELNKEPCLKPWFVRKEDRDTVKESELIGQQQEELEKETKEKAIERRRNTLRMVEDSVRKDIENHKPDTAESCIDDVCTDGSDDEVEYKAWEVRELNRLIRDHQERHAAKQQDLEIKRMRKLTDEERLQEDRINPKVITNKATKGKYKFLQKYYHRGAFYLDEETELLKRDFSQATLEDHYDKTVLPKVMQVKNFGHCGRTKYTHLVDQDTTNVDSPWYALTANNLKFYNGKAGGTKPLFERPSLRKRKLL